MFMYNAVPHFSFIPPPDILAIRDTMRYRRKIVNAMTAEKNRLSNCLTVSGIKLDEVLSDLHGSKTGKALIAQVIEHGGGGFGPEPFIDRRVKATIGEFIEALDGEVEPATVDKMKLITGHLAYLEGMKTDIEQSIASLSSAYQDKIDLLSTIPGIDTISATSIISEIGVDMSQFGSVGQFLSWVGVVPQNNESANKKKTTRIAKGNAWLKPVLVQCANAAIKDKNHPEMRDKHMAIRKRRGFKKAIVATAKRIATCAYFMLLRNEVYNPALAYGKSAPKKGKIELDKLIRHYQDKGYTVAVEGEPLPELSSRAQGTTA